MQFEIEHITRYSYSVPVQLAEHLLRFLPLQTATQQLTYSNIDINPRPFRNFEETDAWGNRIQRIGFAGETSFLEIRAYLEVETREADTANQAEPYSFPIDYGIETTVLFPYLQPMENSAQLQPFLQPLLAEAGQDVSRFLSALNQAVHGFYYREVRLDGPPRTPAETLALGEGVCRDLTVLFMAACRQMGLATRFVSGYQQGDGTRQLRYLHAWPEVYLPNQGWLGYDPTHGYIAGSDHVGVAAAPNASAVTPVEGGYTFNGPEVTSTLMTEIRISTRR
jgi:transglutaminase-like putative cysteine protease